MSNRSVHIGAADVQAQAAQAFIGQVVGAARSRTLLNKNPQAKQVTTIAIPASPDNSTAYSVVIGGVTATYTSDASATRAEVGAGLEAAIEAEPAAYGQMVPSYSGGTLTLTGQYPGVTYTVTASGGSGGGAIGTPATATSAASASSVEPGRLMVAGDFSTGVGLSSVRTGATPLASDYTAQVITLTFATATGAYFSGEVEVNGLRYLWQADHNTDLDTTCTDIANAINAALPANTVLAASVGSASGEVTLTAEVAGAEFNASAAASGAAAASAAIAYTTGPSPSTSIRRALQAGGGISRYRADLEHETVGGEPAYGPNEGVEVVYDAQEIWVETAQTITAGEDVYVSVASATSGRLYNAAGADLVWLPPELLVWQRGTRSDASYPTDAATVRVNLR